jgi:glycosyltransferase involved in cell wall biosynthesis
MASLSVVIPCFNLGRYLPDTVFSVRTQTLLPQEIIVVDDGSTDEFTLKVLDRLADSGVTVIHQVNQGAPAARNAGIRAASGEYILCLDADDMIEPTFLAETSEKLAEHPDVGIVTTRVQLFGEHEVVWHPDINPNRLTMLLRHNVIASASLFRKECWRQAGGYADLEAYQDWNFWISIVEKGWRWLAIPKILYRYRVRKGSITSKAEGKRKALFTEIMKRHEETYAKHYRDIILELDEDLNSHKATVSRYANDAKKLLKAIDGHKEEVRSLADAIRDRDRRIGALENALAEKDRTLASVWGTVAEKDQRIASLWSALEEKDQTLAAAWGVVADKDQRLAALWTTVAEKEEKIAALERTVTQSSQDNTRLQASWDQLHAAHERTLAQQRLQRLASTALPAGANVLVVTKGDSSLLELHNRNGWHFPQTEDGSYTGWYPANSADAIAQLEAMRARRAEYLLFPAAALWWLEFYADFKEHLDRHYTLAASEQGVGMIFALHPRRSGDASSHAAPVELQHSLMS